MPPMPAVRRRALALACAAPILLAACGEQALYSQLSERQANEMVAALRSAGIDAEKTAQEGRFSVATGKSDFPRAIQVLNAQGLPRESFDSRGNVFKREGFVSSPLEEHARLVHAMSQEISGTLASIDGVLTARVHLVVPERHPLADKVQPAAASVFIKHRADRDLSSQVTQIRALVVNSIEGLSYDNVTVALFPAEPVGGPALGTARGDSARPAPAHDPALQGPLLSGSLLGLLAFGGGGWVWWRRRRDPNAPALALPGARPTRPGQPS